MNFVRQKYFIALVFNRKSSLFIFWRKPDFLANYKKADLMLSKATFDYIALQVHSFAEI